MSNASVHDSEHPPFPQDDAPLVLVIEDDPPTRAMMKLLLDQERLTPLVASDIEEGWRILQQGGVRLVISDLHLDALTLIKRMRAEPATAHIPIIIETGERRAELRYAALEAGASSYLIKPYPLTDLVGHIRKWLDDNQA